MPYCHRLLHRTPLLMLACTLIHADTHTTDSTASPDATAVTVVIVIVNIQTVEHGDIVAVDVITATAAVTAAIVHVLWYEM
jgi:hypothetical protein